MHYIYSILNVANGKRYIGLTNNPVRRRNRHFTDLRCKRHDNGYLQRAFHKYGESKFKFEILLEIDCSREEISRLEQEYIEKYDSFNDGYNLNEGGFQNNGFESKLSETDIFNILSVLEFGKSRSGGALGSIYEVSRTTIRRIKAGESHQEYKIKYESLPISTRERIFDGFCRDAEFDKTRNSTFGRKGHRYIDEENVLMILSVIEFGYRKDKSMSDKLGIHRNSITLIRTGETYRDIKDRYESFGEDERMELYQKAIKFFGF